MSSPQPQHVWYYQKSTLLGVSDEGPFTDGQLLQIAKDNQLTLATPIRSPTRTKNQWIKAESIQALAVAINQAKLDAQSKKKAEAEEKRKQKHELAVAKQQAKAEAAKANAIRVSRETKPLAGELLPPSNAPMLQSKPMGSPPELAYQQFRDPTPRVAVTKVVVQRPHSNSFGIASLVLGLLAFALTCVPGVGLVIGGVAFLLGLIGLIAGLARGGTGLGYSIAGVFLSLFPIGITVIALYGAIVGSGALEQVARAKKNAERRAANQGSISANSEGKSAASTPGPATPAKSPPAESSNAEKELLLSKFKVQSAKVEFNKSEFAIGNEVVFVFNVMNDTGSVVKSVSLECAYETPGRSLPWQEGGISYDIPGGLEPGESAEWKLVPNLIGPWRGLEKKDGAVLRFKVKDLKGPDGKSVWESSGQRAANTLASPKKGNEELRSKFLINSATIEFDESELSIMNRVTFVFRVTNGTGKPIKAVHLHCEYSNAGRTLPWQAGSVNYEIPGGLENGESAEWRLSPNILGPWRNLEKKEGATLSAIVEDLIGPDDKSILE